MKFISQLVLLAGTVIFGSLPPVTFAQTNAKTLGGVPYIDNVSDLKSGEVTYCKDGKVATNIQKPDGLYIRESDEKCTVDENKTVSIRNGNIQKLGSEPKNFLPDAAVYYCKGGIVNILIARNGKVEYNGPGQTSRERCIMDESLKECARTPVTNQQTALPPITCKQK